MIEELTATFGRVGGYFFLFIEKQSAMILTINVPRRNKFSYVTITFPLSEGKEINPLSDKRVNRLYVYKVDKIQHDFLSLPL